MLVATSLWKVVHSWTTNDVNWYGPWWWGVEGAGDDYYEGPGWYVASSHFTTMRMSEDPYASEIVYEWTYWGEEEHSVTTRCTRTVQWLTNAVDRVQYRGDVAAATNGVMAGVMGQVTEALGVFQEMGTVAFARQLISGEPGVASVTPSNVWQIAQDATNYTDAAIGAFASTGAVARATVYGTPMRWTDATGCVWEVAGSWWLSPSNYTGSSEWYADRPIYLVATHVPGEWWRPSCEGDFIGIGKGEESSTSLEWRGEDAYIDILALRVIHTNLVGRVALTNDLTGAVSMDVSKTTDESKLLNAPSLQSARVVPNPVQSAYWPNRQRVLKLGDSETVVSADRAEADWLLVRDPSRLLFIDTVTINGSETNYTFKTFQQYLNAVSPETLQESLRGYLPIEGGGSVTGNVEITGDVLVKGTLAAPSLLRVVTADIEANGFSVSNGVLRANSGLVVSNGMCKINCARAIVGIGTPRVHIENDVVGSGITFGGTWDSPALNLNGLIRQQAGLILTDYTTFDESKEVAHFPPIVPAFRNDSNTLPDSVTPNRNGLLTLENLKLNIVGDTEYDDYVVIRTDELPNVKLVDLYVLFNYTTSVPAFYFDEGTFGESPVFHGDSGAFSITAGTPRLVRMKHIGNDEWIVTYKDLTTWNPPMNTPDEQQ